MTERTRGWRAWAAVAGGLLAVLVGAEARPIKPTDGPSAQAMMAEGRLRGGLPMVAHGMAEECLKSSPTADTCRSVRARSAAVMGRCAAAMEDFAALRRAPIWDGRLALAEGLCHVRLGDLSLAIAVFDEAGALREADPLPHFERGMVAVRLGDLDVVRHELESMASMRDAGWMQSILEAWIAVEAGDPAADGLLYVLRNEAEGENPSAVVQAAIMDCRRWMDLGDPAAADAAARKGVKVTMGQARLVACRAEAMRRVGDDTEPLHLATRPWQSGVDSPLLDGAKIRTLVDLGRLDEAAKLAKQHPTTDADGAATAWYLARARGDDAAAAAWARWYATLTPANVRPLTDWIPWTGAPWASPSPTESP